MWDFAGYDYQNRESIEQNRQGTITPDQKQALMPGGQSLGGFIRGGTAWKKLSIPVWLWLFGTIGLMTLDLPEIFPAAFFAAGLAALAGLFFWFWRRYRERNLTIQRELAEDAVRSGMGEVLFIKGDYRVELEGKKLHLRAGGKGNLAPGVRYRFYYLPESRILLSAEALGAAPERQAVRELTEVLAEVNHFDTASLSANRRGLLTGGQLGKLLQPVLIGFFAVGFPAGVFWIGLTGETGFLRPLRDGIGFLSGLRNLNSGVLVISLVLAGIALFGVYFLATALLDLWTREVVFIEGTGLRQRKQSRDSDGSTRERYFYLVGGQEFQVNEQAYQAFENGRKYRAYYTPRRKRLVNLEVLD